MMFPDGLNYVCKKKNGVITCVNVKMSTMDMISDNGITFHHKGDTELRLS